MIRALFRTIALLAALLAAPLSPALAIAADGTADSAADHADSATAGFPYRAEVVAPDAEVFSGPGEQFYATDRLAPGTVVEVHRHEADGWCAIRPPAESFSWVRLDAVEVQPDGRHVCVTRDDAFSYVGSKFSDDHEVEYIPLVPGERLRLLGSRMLRDPRTGERGEWVQVAPPDGEFRWIRRQAIAVTSADGGQRGAPRDVTASPRISQPAAVIDRDVRQAGWSDGGGELADEQPSARGPDPRSLTAHPMQLRAINAPDLATAPWSGADRQPATNAGEVDEPTDGDDSRWQPRGSGAVERSNDFSVASAVEGQGVAEHDGGDSRGAESSDGVNENIRQLTEASDWIDQLRALDLQLSTIVTQPVELWESDLRSLRSAARQLAFQLADDPEAREQLSRLNERIEQFQRVQDRYQALALPERASGDGEDARRPSVAAPRLVGTRAASAASQGPATSGEADRGSAVTLAAHEAVSGAGSSVASTLDIPAGPGLPGAPGHDTPFDGEGMLMPVFTSRSDVPEYALTDSRGRILQFVSGSDEVNLGKYVRKHVGVYGTRGFLPTLQQQHLTATRVVVLGSDD